MTTRRTVPTRREIRGCEAPRDVVMLTRHPARYDLVWIHVTTRKHGKAENCAGVLVDRAELLEVLRELELAPPSPP